VGDGAVGLSAVIGAKQLGAEKIIIMSRNPERQALAKAFGATHIVEERGEEGIAKVMELTDGVGAHGVAEAVGTQQSFDQALGCVRHGGYIGFVGVPHDSSIGTDKLFGKQVHLEGGPAPVRKYLPTLIDLIYKGEIEPGRVFDLVLPIDEAAKGYEAMDQRTATKVLLTMN
ncbi:MAG: IMP dehydrogenase, partial [Rothia mucilaginosa]|nr:IMP dehydrogenase [Rothia mucilaginosa]